MVKIKFRKITKLTEYVLRNNQDSRSNDGVLFFEVCKQIQPNIWNLPFGIVMQNLKGYDLPTPETVSRCRRKIQRAFPELRSNRVVEEGRILREEEFINFNKKCQL